MNKIKIASKLSALALLAAGINSFAACTPNITNTANSRSTTLSSSTAGDCVENSGTIAISSPPRTFGINSTGASTSNTNSNTITTSVLNGYGIFSEGDDSINNNSGSINTSGEEAFGIAIEGNGSNTYNSGTIETSGLRSHGIVGGDSIFNSGTIETSGQDAHGIYSVGENTTNSNSGTIQTGGNSSYAIYSSGYSTTNTNSGNINTTGIDAYGINTIGANSNIVNSGTISSTGSYAIGIRSNGDNSIITNNGIIATTGYVGWGVRTTGLNSTITNNRIITTSGNSAAGLKIYGDNSIITNNGTIATSGNTADGILSVGNNIIINNSGSIRIADGNSAAITLGNAVFYGANNNTVNLLKGSIIVGDIHADTGLTGAKLNINLGSGASYAYSVTGPWTVTDLDNRPMITGSAYAAGIGAQETASEMLYQRTSSITSALDRRLRSYASDEVDNQPYWLDVYYSDASRNSGGNYSTRSVFSNYNYGFTAGFKLPVELTPLELVVTAQKNNLNIDSGNQIIDSTSLMVGLIAPSITEFLGAKLSAKALVGFANNDGDRKVMTNSLLYNGSRQIKSDYNSTYAVLGTALTKLYPINDRLTADALVGLDLATQHIKAYAETDYFAWQGRTLNQLQSRIQVGLDYRFNQNKASLFARVGAERRDLISGGTQDYSINGTNVSFNTNNSNDTYITAQLGIKAHLEKRVELFAIVNGLNSSDAVTSVQGNIGLRADF